MSTLFNFINILILLVIGFASLAGASLLVMLIIIYSYKAAKLLISMLNAAINEPENKVVDKVRKLSKRMKKPTPAKPIINKKKMRGTK